MTRKQREAASASAKLRIAEELEIIREKLMHAGNILHLFVDETVSDNTQFGDIRQNAFTIISKDEIQLISQHLNKNSFDKTHYEWLYIDTQYRKIANTMRSLLAIDIECEHGIYNCCIPQLLTAKLELQKDSTFLPPISDYY
ncbi:hypothetical protein [Providencia hangzhouensis]|uniref:hypothetical protein n=1 Tax=Providencia hangzhouensis TaxID=3031799 RepID=UPI0034DD9F38